MRFIEENFLPSRKYVRAITPELGKHRSYFSEVVLTAANAIYYSHLASGYPYHLMKMDSARTSNN